MNDEFREKTRHLRVAVVHDWIFTRRGGEKVLEEILELFPMADLHYLFGNPEKVLRLSALHRMVPSFLNRVPGIERIYKHLLPLLPLAAESFDLQGYDLVISSSSCVAKGVVPSPLGVHVSYIHSPMRYAWDQEHRYFPKAIALSRPLELARRLILSHLRQWDVTSAQRIDTLVANSAFVARRCELFYGRPATVVHPPVDVEAFAPQTRTAREERVLLFGAWVPYKRMRHALDLLVEAGIPVTAAGQGKDLEKAAAELGNQATFVLSPSDAQVRTLYASHKVLLFPAIEDFGIVPLEAMASGQLVVAPGAGGTAETVLHGVSGFHFRRDDDAALLDALRRALSHTSSEEDVATTQAHVQRFSRQTFREKLAAVVLQALQKHMGGEFL